jgi:hypothetical protein
MTTKPKTRKPAAKTVTPEEFVSLPYDRTTADIRKMIARLRFLEADLRYHAEICDQDMRHLVPNIRHREERDEIMQRLAKAAPDCFDDASALLEFATALAKSSKAIDGMDKQIIAMLKNAATGFFKAHWGARFDNALQRFDERQFAVEDA